MNILYYYWQENSYHDMYNAFIESGHTVKTIQIPFKSYDKDDLFSETFKNYLKENTYDCIFSFDFFPLISNLAHIEKIPYISWVYDMAHWTLYSPMTNYPTNYIFIFDREFCDEIKKLAPDAHIYHLPLAAGTPKVLDKLGEPPMYSGHSFDVTFAGSMYEKCLFNQINYLPEYLRGYLDAIMSTQELIYGCKIIPELLTDTIIEEMKEYIKVDIPSQYNMTHRMIFSDMLGIKTTSNERIHLLESASSKYNVTLFSGSNNLNIPNLHLAGYADYNTEIPAIFRTSKINLNIAAKTITSGIALRAFEIMHAGGFLLSNYSIELAEYFEDGKDLAMFSSKEELMDKIDYYLAHDAERTTILCNGYRKVREDFSYKKRIQTIMEKVF